MNCRRQVTDQWVRLLLTSGFPRVVVGEPLGAERQDGPMALPHKIQVGQEALAGNGGAAVNSEQVLRVV